MAGVNIRRLAAVDMYGTRGAKRHRRIIRAKLMSFLHPELPQGVGWFDRFEPDSFRWLRALFAWPSNTALAVAGVSRIGNDRTGSRGAQGSERVMFHVVQGQHGLDQGGALARIAAQLGGQHLPVLQAGVPALADAAELGL